MMQLTLNLLLQVAALTATPNRDYAAAYYGAERAGKPLVVLIGTDWCPGCHQMEKTALPEVEKRGGLRNVSFAYVNADKQSALAGKLMSGGSIPQLVVYQ